MSTHIPTHLSDGTEINSAIFLIISPNTALQKYYVHSMYALFLRLVLG